MTKQTKQRKFWQRVFRRGRRKAEVPTEPVVKAQVTEVPEVKIAPDDPILAYFASVSGLVEIEKLELNSPALREMKAAA